MRNNSVRNEKQKALVHVYEKCSQIWNMFWILIFCKTSRTLPSVSTKTFFIISYFFVSSEMPTTARSSGNWSEVQEGKLQKLLHSNTIDYRNRSPDYLFQVTKDHFPDFISERGKGRNSTIQCMRGKFITYEEEMQIQGARHKSVLIICVTFY